MIALNHHKYELTNTALRDSVASVLDVGCRDAVLKKFLRSDVSYSGLDLFPGPGVDHVGNVEEGLPFSDRSFDAVVALDLLEHTNNIWFVYDELMRVASEQVIVLLPNAYHWFFRLQYLSGREMGKYVLPVEPILDRHRWLLSQTAARNFCEARAKANGWRLTEKILFSGRRTAVFDLALSSVSKNLAAWSTIFFLDRP